MKMEVLTRSKTSTFGLNPGQKDKKSGMNAVKGRVKNES